jgi:predicted nucleic acid-binding protein
MRLKPGVEPSKMRILLADILTFDGFFGAKFDILKPRWLLTATGRPRSALDMIVAAIADANECVVVTDNERDFAGLEIVNPLRKANR